MSGGERVARETPCVRTAGMVVPPAPVPVFPGESGMANPGDMSRSVARWSGRVAGGWTYVPNRGRLGDVNVYNRVIAGDRA
jgi:hypothetical protein